MGFGTAGEYHGGIHIIIIIIIIIIITVTIIIIITVTIIVIIITVFLLLLFHWNPTESWTCWSFINLPLATHGK